MRERSEKSKSYPVFLSRSQTDDVRWHPRDSDDGPGPVSEPGRRRRKGVLRERWYKTFSSVLPRLNGLDLVWGAGGPTTTKGLSTGRRTLVGQEGEDWSLGVCIANLSAVHFGENLHLRPRPSQKNRTRMCHRKDRCKRATPVSIPGPLPPHYTDRPLSRNRGPDGPYLRQRGPVYRDRCRVPVSDPSRPRKLSVPEPQRTLV